MGAIKAGVTVMQDFCRPGTDVFSSYIDYMSREEAQRNHAISTFNLFNDYMGNPEKSTGLFTAEKDALTLTEKNQLKDIFMVAQDNGSVMWQTVVSFDNAWLEKNGVYKAGQGVLDEQRIKDAARKAVGRMLKSEGMEQAVWSAGIHYNTDNLHVHVAIVEPYPMREKMLYKGNLEVRGKFKMGSINECKRSVVNELMQTREINQRINFLIRKDIVDSLKQRELSEDPILREKFLELCQQLPDVPGNMLNYNNRGMGAVRKQADEISKIFLGKYCPEKYQDFLEITEHQSRLYAEAYGGGKWSEYKEDKEEELLQRMGNAILKSAKTYVGKMEEKTAKYEQKITGELLRGIAVDPEVGKEAIPDEETETWAIETGMNEEAEAVGAGAGSEEVTVESDESPFLLKKSDLKAEADHEKFSTQKRELLWELEQAERYLRQKETLQEREKVFEGNGKTGSEETYGEWFGQFKEERKALNEALCQKGKEKTEDIVDRIMESAGENPFSKCLLGEMYLYGKLTEISTDAAQKCFEEALVIFERDVEQLPPARKTEGFSFRSYLEYRIGKQYMRGWGTEYDPEIAAEWLEKSDTPYAKYSLGNLYYDGEGVEQDFDRAYALYTEAYSPFAKLKCGEMSEKGIGTERNPEKSEEFYAEAYSMFLSAERKQEDALFEYRIGSMLYQGKGCEQNTEKAVWYLEKSAAQKNVPAVLLLSNINVSLKRTEGMPELISMLEELSEKSGLEDARYVLGRIYMADWEFYDLKKGAERYREAAEQGHEYAQYQIGKLYVDSELEIYDLQKGIHYLEASAEQGNEPAQYRLGCLYLDVRSPAYQPEKGMEYIQLLAEKGNEYAQTKLGFEYLKGEHIQKDFFAAREWFGKAAEQGNPVAEAMLRDMTAASRQQQQGRKYNPLGELDKALMYLRKSMYEAQRETQRNLLLYEKELQEELQKDSIYI